MRDKLPKTNKYGAHLALGIAACTILNFALAYAVSLFNMPLYMDACGTMLISIMGSGFAGIITAVATSILCVSFNPDSMYFTFIGVLVAVCTYYFASTEKYRKKLNMLLLLIVVSFVSGVSASVFQWILFGKPQFAYVEDFSLLLSHENKILYFVYSILLVVALNIVDKSLSMAIALAIYHLIPRDIRIRFWNSGWKQRPISKKELFKINSELPKKGMSLRVKFTFMLVTASLTISIVLGVVSIKMNYEAEMQNGISTVTNVTSFAASRFEPTYFEHFLYTGEKVPDYKNREYVDTNEMLLQLKNSFPDIEYLYVYHIREDACYILFDTDPSFQEKGTIGERLEFDESFLPLIPNLLRGEKIPVQMASSRYGYMITAYEPICDSKGNPSSYYVGADILVKNYSDYIVKYILKVFLVFSGFIALALAYGIWESQYNFVYPIGSLERSIEGFMKGIEEQDKLDDSVRKLQKLDISTNDEIEKLYRLVCEMAVATVEQMRSIRTLVKSNKKMQTGLIITMADIVENRNFESTAHIQRTVGYVRIVLAGLKRKGYYAEKLTDKYMNEVELSAPLYDIGKIKVPDLVLNKPGKLSEGEFEIIKTHADAGRKILENAISSVEGEDYLKEALNMAAYHHERWDGRGYPEGLHGQVIPLSARIMAVADVFDALTSERVYKPAYSLETSFKIMQEGAGTQFDPKCVEVFLDSVSEIKKVMKKYR